MNNTSPFVYVRLNLETTPDKHPRVWTLYKPMLVNNQEPMHLWMRQCELFTTEELAKETLNNRIGAIVNWQHHELFPELQIGVDSRGFRWLLEPAPIQIS